jgi:dephospho-CoA kinase
MKIIGLLGGVASGKSMVANQLADLGAKVLDADKIGHEVLELPEVIDAIHKRWGDSVVDQHGKIIRSQVAKIVFAPLPKGQDERTFLEQLTHPLIIGLMQKRTAECKKAGVPAVVFDASLLAEAEMTGLCDLLVFVDCGPEIRLNRALDRGWKKADFEAREAAQKSLDFKQSQADVVIDNSGSTGQTQVQILGLWQSLFR